MIREQPSSRSHQLTITGLPALAGIELHMQTVDLDFALLRIGVSEPTTVQLQ